MCISETESAGASAWADALAGGRPTTLSRSFNAVIDPQEECAEGSASGWLSRNFVQAPAQASEELVPLRLRGSGVPLETRGRGEPPSDSSRLRDPDEALAIAEANVEPRLICQPRATRGRSALRKRLARLVLPLALHLSLLLSLFPLLSLPALSASLRVLGLCLCECLLLRCLCGVGRLALYCRLLSTRRRESLRVMTRD